MELAVRKNFKPLTSQSRTLSSLQAFLLTSTHLIPQEIAALEAKAEFNDEDLNKIKMLQRLARRRRDAQKLELKMLLKSSPVPSVR